MSFYSRDAMTFWPSFLSTDRKMQLFRPYTNIMLVCYPSGKRLSSTDTSIDLEQEDYFRGRTPFSILCHLFLASQ